MGAGQMGAGIAQVAAQAGDEVLLHDVEQRFIDRGLQTIERNLSRAVDKGRMTEEQRGGVLAHIDSRLHWEDFEVDAAIEAATENVLVKLDIFAKMDEYTPPTAILASNTSSISITKLGAATTRPERVIGMHYFNPVPVMRLVEVIRGLATSDATFEFVRDLAIRHGKTPVAANDYPGFISNRILCPMLNEAVYTLYEGYGDPKYRPCPLLRNYVAAGWIGRKVGRGFYDYRGGAPKASVPPDGSARHAPAARE